MHTPGHTSDSYSFLMDNYLFSGDTLLINGTEEQILKMVIQRMPTINFQQTIKTS